MGLIICPIHGDSGFSIRFSKKIIDAINSNKKLNADELNIFKIVLIDDDDGEILSEEEYLLLNSESLHMNLPNEVKADSEETYDFFYSKLPTLDGICFNCLQDYKKKYNISLLDFR